MENSHAISTLVARRAKIAGLILDLEKEIENHRASLMHLDATLRILDPSINLHKIRATHRAGNRSGYFALGELSQRCQDGIREAGEAGVTVEQVVLVAMRDKGIEGDQKLRHDLIRRFYWTMGRLRRAGHVEKFGRGRDVRWKARADT